MGEFSINLAFHRMFFLRTKGVYLWRVGLGTMPGLVDFAYLFKASHLNSWGKTSNSTKKKSIKICGEKRSKKSHGFGDFDGYHLLGCSKLPTNLRTFRIRPELIVSNVFKSSHVGATHIQGDGLSIHANLDRFMWKNARNNGEKSTNIGWLVAWMRKDWPPPWVPWGWANSSFSNARLGVPGQVAGGCHILLQMWQGADFWWILGGFFGRIFGISTSPKVTGK